MNRPVCRFFARDTLCCGGGVGLVSDRPGTELLLLCSQAITLSPGSTHHCPKPQKHFLFFLFYLPRTTWR